MKSIQHSLADMETVTFTVQEDEAGQRIDVFLAALLSDKDISRSRVKNLATAGNISCNNQEITSVSRKVKAGDILQVDIPAPAELSISPIDMHLDVIFEDKHLLVLNKPAGLTVHPAAGNYDYTLVHGLLYHCGDSLSGIGGVMRPGIVHRLDKDTSGLMVVAKNDKAHHHLSAQLADRTLSRKYHAFVFGCVSPDNGIIEGRIGRSPRDRKKMSVLRSGGKYAKTFYRIIDSYSIGTDRKRHEDLVISHVECTLETGRTHQIRVHMTHIGHPLIGDKTYGHYRTEYLLRLGGTDIPSDIADAIATMDRQALHAKEIGFIHPESGEKMHFSCNLPKDMQNLLDLL